MFDILEKLKTFAPKKDILNAKENKQWVNYSLQDFIDSANYVGSALLALGFKPGSNVAIMSGNSPQWNFVDYGCQQVAMPTAPIYPTISNDDLKFILNHCEAGIIFISDKNVYQKLSRLRSELPHLKHIYTFSKLDGVPHFSEFLELGKQNFDAQKIDAIKQSVRETDMMTILYTSGTTGVPKGVMISHKNLMSNVHICKDIVDFSTQWRALSFLPLNHVYERFLNTLYLFQGVSIYYAESFETIGENCREIHPHIFVAVPRVLERVLDRISTAGEKLGGVKKKLFDWSMRIAERYELCGKNGMWYELQRSICDALIYKKWRAAVGGEILYVVSGGAALNPKLERIFTCAKITLLQGYGLTESCVVVAVNRKEEERRMFGTVGLVVENTEVKIAEEDGEILVKSPSVMLGYYKNPEATAESIDSEGWLHTGDVGTLVDGKFLKITDRKKEIFKISSGKYISPVAIENKLKECRYIEQCMVIGSGQKFASAIIIPSVAAFKEYCVAQNISVTDNNNLHSHDELRRLINDHVKKTNATLAAFEQVKRHQLINAVWSVDSGEITPKLSLKRKIITERNKEVIDRIFGTEED